MSRFRPAVWAMLALGSLVLSLYSGIVFGGQVFFARDLHLVVYPQIAAFVRAVSTGSWPIWDPASCFGQPLLADPEAEVLYPLTWLSLLVRPWDYYAIFVVTHTWLSGVGLYLLGRRLGLGSAASLGSAAIWITCGPLQSAVELCQHFAGACWMPWVLLAGDVALARLRPLSVAAWGLAIAGQILAGSADMCALTGCAQVAYVATHHLRWRAGWDERNRRVVASCAMAALLALGLTAALWMPALDVVSRSARRGLPWLVRTYWSVHPLALLDIVFPNVWQGVIPRPHLAFLRESREPLLDSYYLGVAALPLVGAVLARRTPRTARLFLFLGAAATLVALGRHAPFYGWVVTLVPPLRILRYPVKALLLTAFSWALLAGFGFESLRNPEPPSSRRFRLSVVLPVLCVAALAWAGSFVTVSPALRAWLLGLWARYPPARPPQELLESFQQKLVVTAILATAAAFLALLSQRRWSRPRWVAGGLALLAVGDLGVYHAYRGFAPRALVQYRPEALSFLPDSPDARLFVYDYLFPGASAAGLPSRLQLARSPGGWDESQSLALGLQMALAYASAQRWGLRGSYEGDLKGLHPAHLVALTGRVRELEKTPAFVKLLRMGAVTHAITLHDPEQPGLVPVAVLPGLLRYPIRIFRVPDPLPRAYAIARTRIAGDAEALARFAQPDWDPARELLLPEGQPSVPAAPFEGTVRVREERADRLTLEADLSEPGYVVLVDTFDPGWRATVDGRPGPVLRANVAFRAVAVPAGLHVVSFVYRPAALRLGVLSSLLTVLLAGVGVAIRRRRGGRAPAPSSEAA